MGKLQQILSLCVLLSALPDNAKAWVPASIRQTISISNGTSVTVELNLLSIRSPNFGVLVQDNTGKLNPYAPVPESSTYLGTVQGYPGAMAAGVRKLDGTLLCRVIFEDGVQWLSSGRFASLDSTTPSWTPKWPTSVVTVPSPTNSVVRMAEVGVDASYSEYVAANSNIDSTIQMVEFSIATANMPHLRDASIFHRLGKLVIRSSQVHDPYASTSTNVLLNEVRRQWNTVIRAAVGNTHQIGLVVRPGANGGLAYVRAVGNSNAFSSNGARGNGDFTIIWRHEVGHNWGSSHFEGGNSSSLPEGPTIMSGNSLSRFSSSELVKIFNYKNTLSNILPVNNSFPPLPPRANMDTARFSPNQPVEIDVMANDMDGDVKRLKLLTFPSFSNLKGTLTRKVTGNQRDRIVYTPPAGIYNKLDYFSYRIQNVHGRTSTGYVVVKSTTAYELSAVM